MLCSPPLHRQFLSIPHSLLLGHPCPWQQDCTLVGPLCTSALKTSFRKQSLAYWPMVRGKRSNLPSQLIRRCYHLWQLWPLQCVVPAAAGSACSDASVVVPLQGAACDLPQCAATRAGGTGVHFALSHVSIFQTFWCLVEEEKSHC